MHQPADQMQQQQQQPAQQQQQIILPAGFIENPSGYLVNIASRAPTPDGLEKLAGPVAKWFVSAANAASATTTAATMGHIENTAAAGGGSATASDYRAAVQVAPFYLQAASVQLKGYDGGGGGGRASSGAAATSSSSTASSANNRQQTQSSIQLEMVQTKHQYQVLEAVGCIASSLLSSGGGSTDNRSAISQILPTLSMLMVESQNNAAAAAAAAAAATTSNDGQGRFNPNDVAGGGVGFGAIASAIFGPSSARTIEDVAQTVSGLDANNNSDTGSSGNDNAYGQASTMATLSQFPPLQQVSVEFLQCALAAEQYRYAAQLIDGTWPRPTSTVNVKTVLRYFYLRGMIHLGCQDYIQAHRCWWACLSVPSSSDSNDACSAIAVAAWKKMVLVQPMINHRCNRTMMEGGMSTSGGGKTKASNSTDKLPPMPKSASKALTKKVDTDDSCKVYSTIHNAACRGDVKAMDSFLQPSTGNGSGDGENTNMTDASTSADGNMNIAVDLTVSVLGSGKKQQQSAYPFLVADGNYGLAQECLKQARCNQVWQTSQLFSAVSFEQLARRWDIPIDQVAARLMEASSIDGPRGLTRSIGFYLERPESQPDNIGQTIVVFDQSEDDDHSNGGARFPSSASFSSFSDIGEWMKLLERVQLLDVSIATNSKYHSLAKREGKSGTRDVGMRDADNVTQAFGR